MQQSLASSRSPSLATRGDLRLRRQGKDRRPRRSASYAAVSARRGHLRFGAKGGPGSSTGLGAGTRGLPRRSHAGTAQVFEIVVAQRNRPLQQRGVDRCTRSAAAESRGVVNISVRRTGGPITGRPITLAEIRSRWSHAHGRRHTAIEAMAADSEFTSVVHRLGCMRGVSTLPGFALAVEIGDWNRFSGNAIGSFVGLVPTDFFG